MALQYSVAVRDAQADQLETTIGASPNLDLRSGGPPANCAAASTGTLLATLALPADWLTASAAGLKQKNGAWTGTGAAAGTIAHYRIMQGATCHQQGTVTITGGGGDMTVDNTSIAIAQVVTVTQYDLTRGNA